MIAQKAGISKGLIYNYFESKEVLLKEIIKGGVQDVWQYFDPNRDGILTKDEFIFFIKKSIQIVKENTIYWKLYTALMFQPDVVEMLITDYDNISAHYYRLAYDLFIRSNIKDPEAELILFGSMIKGAIIQYVAMPDDYPIDKFETALENYYKNILNI
jgi:AcrR family transcriptional regulator